MDYQEMHRILTENHYLCSELFAAQVAAALATRPVAGAFLTGPAGTGKTFLPEVLGAALGAEYCFQQMYPGSREDDLLVKLIPDDTAVSGIKAVPGVVIDAIRALQAGRQAMLVLDEWDKTRPSADAFLLDFLQHGRVRYNGYSARLTADELGHLTVFITLNDERELSEPLLRRLPRIDFAPLPTGLVRAALERTHGGHPHLDAAVRLYQLCCAAELPKPATIQELRQLLDAITILGDLADWDTLVYQFVTKSPESHALLARVEQQERLVRRSQERARLDASRYEEPEKELEEKVAPPELPRLRRPAPLVAKGEAPDLSASAGIVALSDAAYDNAVGRAVEPTDDPAALGDVAEVVTVGERQVISFREPLPLVDWEWAPWGEKGEMLFTEPLATLDDVLALRQRGLVVTKFCRAEVVGRAEGVELRWTPQEGAEAIVNLEARRAFERLFGAGKSYSSDSWLYRSQDPDSCGIMIQRRIKPAEPPPPYRRERGRELERARTVRLGGGLPPARIEITRGGQEGPEKSDHVTVTASLYLPAGADSYLRPEITFGNRVYVANEHLGYCWGQSSKPEPYRFRTRQFAAPTYAAAASQAAIWAHEQLCRLLVALRQRRQAAKGA